MVDSDESEDDFNPGEDSDDFHRAVKGKSKTASVPAATNRCVVPAASSMDRIYRKRKYVAAAASVDGVHRKRVYGGATTSKDGVHPGPQAGASRGQRLIKNILRAEAQLHRQEEDTGAAAIASSPEHKPPTQKGPARKVRRIRLSPFQRKSGSVLHREDDQEMRVALGALAVRLQPKRATRAVVNYAVTEAEDEEDNQDRRICSSSDFDAEESA